MKVFRKDDTGFRWQLPDLEVSEIGYTLAHRQFVKNGREILDATVDGKLHIFPKVKYEEIVGDLRGRTRH